MEDMHDDIAVIKQYPTAGFMPFDMARLDFMIILHFQHNLVTQCTNMGSGCSGRDETK